MKNWKTTLAGILGAVLMVLVSPNPVKPDLRTIVGAAATAAVGALAKDSDVTGGTREQDSKQLNFR